MASKQKHVDLSLPDFTPHDGQIPVLEAFEEHEVTIYTPGRRAGKTTLRKFVIYRQTARNFGWVEGCYMGPSHADAQSAYEADLLDFGNADLVRGNKNEDQFRYIDFAAIVFDPVPEHLDLDMSEFGESRCVCFDCASARKDRIRLGGAVNEGGRVWYPSGAPEAHRKFQGKGLHWVMHDEFSHQPSEAFFETTAPMLADTGGPALIIGSFIPEGINYAGFVDLANMGDPSHKSYEPGYVWISGRSEDNPHIDHRAVQAARDRLIRTGRASLAACLYDGVPMSDLGAVFGNLDRVFSLNFTLDAGVKVSRLPTAGESVAVGVDLGAGGEGDPTIVSAFSVDTLEQLALAKIDEPNYFQQIPRVDRIIKMFGRPRIWCEGRESGAMFSQYMQRVHGEYCQVVKWASGGHWDKNAQVNRGMDLCQQTGAEGMRGWRLINDPEQKEEFRLFARSKTDKGSVTYAAPKGKHDDHVAAALYAAYGLPIEVAESVRVAPKPLKVFSTEWLKMVQRGSRGMAVTTGPGKMPM